METNSSSGVPSTQLRMWSQALLAALNALLMFLICNEFQPIAALAPNHVLMDSAELLLQGCGCKA